MCVVQHAHPPSPRQQQQHQCQDQQGNVESAGVRGAADVISDAGNHLGSQMGCNREKSIQEEMQALVVHVSQAAAGAGVVGDEEMIAAGVEEGAAAHASGELERSKSQASIGSADGDGEGYATVWHDSTDPQGACGGRGDTKAVDGAVDVGVERSEDGSEPGMYGWYNQARQQRQRRSVPERAVGAPGRMDRTHLGAAVRCGGGGGVGGGGGRGGGRDPGATLRTRYSAVSPSRDYGACNDSDSDGGGSSPAYLPRLRATRSVSPSSGAAGSGWGYQRPGEPQRDIHAFSAAQQAKWEAHLARRHSQLSPQEAALHRMYVRARAARQRMEARWVDISVCVVHLGVRRRGGRATVEGR
jgi:hypothetical protein